MRGNLAPMITKILFTAAIIFVMVLVIRKQTSGRPVLHRPPAPTQSAQGLLKVRQWQWMVYGFLGLMVSVSVLFVFFEWRDQYRVIDVHVINSQTGEAIIYQARLSDVDGRHFKTVEGRLVTVADVERIEVSPGRKE